jgi:hypothetical protein
MAEESTTKVGQPARRVDETNTSCGGKLRWHDKDCVIVGLNSQSDEVLYLDYLQRTTT